MMFNRKRGFITKNLSLSPSHRSDMIEIVLKDENSQVSVTSQA